MRPSIATVIGPGWEPRLVAHARNSGLARLVGRCCDPSALADVASRADTVYIGSDVSWLVDTDLRHLNNRTRLIGVAADAPGERLLDRAGVSEIVDASTPPSGLLSLALAETERSRRKLIEVTGPRGAPGRSEVALALAFATNGCLVEADRPGPSLGLRMALPPTRQRTPVDLDDAVFCPETAGPEAPALDLAELDRLRSLRLTTIVDTGPDGVLHRVADVDRVVIVGEATDVGVVRLARLCEGWMGPTPALVVNRHQEHQDLRRVIRATGLEPAAVIPILPQPGVGEAPHPRMRSAVSTLADQRIAL